MLYDLYPYLPPTQRSFMDNKGYTGQVHGIDGVTGQGQNLIEEHGIVETRRIDLSSCGADQHLNPDGFGGNVAPPVSSYSRSSTYMAWSN